MSLVLQEISKQYIATPQGLEQVYQNRLVEGEDFERWDNIIKETSSTATIGNFSPGEEGMMISVGYNSYVKSTVFLRFFTSTGKNVTIHIGEQGYRYYEFMVVNNNDRGSSPQTFWRPYTELGRHTFFFKNGILKVGTKTLNIGSSINVTGDCTGFQIGGKSGCGVSYHGNDRYSPVKLLAPCPPNLSANGKAYPIGECGMIDSVSGKFYGNSGSGSFSVYNDTVTE